MLRHNGAEANLPAEIELWNVKTGCKRFFLVLLPCMSRVPERGGPEHRPSPRICQSKYELRDYDYVRSGTSQHRAILASDERARSIISPFPTKRLKEN